MPIDYGYIQQLIRIFKQLLLFDHIHMYGTTMCKRLLSP
jgi:hypothetical protein